MKKRSPQFSDWLLKLFPEDADMCKTITFQVTDKCNLQCTYCYQINKGIRVMSFDVAKTFIDKLLAGDPSIASYINVDNSPGIVIEFIGGEPFLEIDLIDRIVDYFRLETIRLNHPWAYKYAISFSSNGTLYFDEKVQRFLSKNKDHVSLSITVDGTKELHDKCRVFPTGAPSYDLAHSAAMDWMSRGYDMGTKITLCPENVAYMNECLQAIIKDGHDEVMMNTVYEEGWSPDTCRIIYEQCKLFTEWFKDNCDPLNFYCSFLERIACEPKSMFDNENWCGGVGSMLGIDPDGYMYPCIRYMESSIGDTQVPYRIGDVYNGFFSREDECNRRDCMICVTRRSQSSDECFYCPISTQCGWCSAYNYQINGTVDKRVTYSCDAHKARVLSTVYFWNTLHLINPEVKAVDLWCPEQWAVPLIGSDNYAELVDLTKRCNKFVNANATQVYMHKQYEFYDNPADILLEKKGI